MSEHVRNNRNALCGGLFTLAVMLCLSGPATAQDEKFEIGEREFMRTCATCHGPEGKGNGPFANFLAKPLPDLTQLQKNNNGTFPVERIYKIIDGREMIKGHGTSEMPVWGEQFTIDVTEQARTYQTGTPLSTLWLSRNHDLIEDIVQGRILKIVFYLQSIQN